VSGAGKYIRGAFPGCYDSLARQASRARRFRMAAGSYVAPSQAARPHRTLWTSEAHLQLPDLVAVDVLVTLEPDELGLHILQVLSVWPAHLTQIELRTFLDGALQGYGATPKQEEAAQAIREAWAWLEGQALLVTDTRYLGAHTIRILSRKGRRLAGDQKARRTA
jgi:hypothetical protein